MRHLAKSMQLFLAFLLAMTAFSGAALAEAPQTLVFWNVSYRTVDDTGVIETDDLIFNKTIRAFEEANNCKVEVVNQTYDNVTNLFQTAGLAQNGPDICFLWAGSFTNDYEMFIEPMDSYFTADELAGFPSLDLCRAGYKSDGALLGIPTESTTLNLFYNKTLFAKAGIAEDVQIRTFDELAAICEKLKAADIQPFTIKDGPGWTSAWVVGELLTDKLGPQNIYGLMDGTVRADGPEFTAATKAWADFGRKMLASGWCNADAFTTTSDETIVPFYTGQAAMIFGGSWDALTLNTELGDDVDTVMIPGDSLDDPYIDYITSQFSNNLVVTNYSKNKELAVKLVKACTSPEFNLVRYEQDFQTPARIDVSLADASVINKLAEKCYTFIQKNKNVTGFDSIMSADGSAEFYRQAPIIITGSSTLEDGLKAIQDKNDAAIAAAGK